MAKALVVGGGIGGLATAVGLYRLGWDVKVYEKSQHLGEVGAGLSLFPNALTALEYLGVLSAMPVAHRTISGGIRTDTGRWLARQDISDDGLNGKEFRAVHRAELHNALRGALPEDVIVTGARVLHLSPIGGATIEIGGNTTRVDRVEETADVIIAADGIHSTARRILWPMVSPPEYTGITAWRGISATRPGHDYPLTQSWGRGSEFGIVPLADGRTYWYAATHSVPGITYPNHRTEVLTRFGSWHQPIPDIVTASAPDDIVHHDLFHVRQQPQSFVSGRVVLLGDAAHAIPPFLGQGACQALEDAATLAALLGPADTSAGASVESALRTYDTLRVPRARQIARATALAAQIGIRARGPITNRARNAAVWLTPPILAQRAMSRIAQWEVPRDVPTR
ncbi:FAD-dependent monooxygenase [Hoyosella rhizosphaerae]|uniref:FAD-dependent oxidoreductase n=1 Tax=Hoyosella rhizosphaerae TaxID=1755582 RepID=A0A916X9G0_9ACTN|nr:FAD-dependent monooxygenase [Hoyosella rhizosphaerae]MBN4927023.1 FAD-dependent monooxygenase [Hoyosella rhizosphaerae]GGC54662.1 FAD-dependent oxidoreductase [Hoyosella rhizosphaerae]